MGHLTNRIAVATCGAMLRAWWRIRTVHVPHTPERIAPVGGFGLAYDTFGWRDAPPVLLIAGFGQQMIGWDDSFCALLAARGFRVIRFDNRNMGHSSKLSSAPARGALALVRAWTQLHPARWLGSLSGTHLHTLRDMADDAAGLLTALEIDSAHAVGISLGGMIGQLLAIHHPERVRTLTSISSTTGDPVLGRPNQSVLWKLLTPAPHDRDGFAEHAVGLWRLLRATNDVVEDALERKRAVRMVDRGVSPEAARRQLVAVLKSRSWKSALASVTAPTLVIHGELDPLIPVAAGRDTAEAVPGAKLLLLPDVGHALPASSWRRVIGAIAQHARQFEAAQAGNLTSCYDAR